MFVKNIQGKNLIKVKPCIFAKNEQKIDKNDEGEALPFCEQWGHGFTFL